ISAEEFEKLPDEEAEELFIAAGDEADSALIERVEEEALSQVEEDGMFAVAEDPELVEVFVEEAKELLEQIESSYQHWMDNQSDESAIDAIQRILHTLKGSARLSGILPVGDLSHALESLFSKIADKNVLITGRLLELTRQAIDRIAHQIDEVATGGALSRAGKLVKQLESILGSKEASAEISSFAAESTDSLLAPSSIDEFEADSDFAMLDAGLTTDLAEETTQSEETAETEGAESALEPEVEPEPEPGESEALKRIIRFPKQPQQPPAPAQENLPQGTAFRPARDQVRVSATLLDRLVNNAGEISIYRARLEQQNGVLGFNLAELEQTITRLFDQLRKLEIETEAQILYRWDRDHGQDDKNRAEFDPLELDRFSTMQQLSRALMETVNDLGSINGLLADLQRETDTLLLQQSRISTDLQDGLLRTRMVPFQQLVPRLQRVVRQTADQLGKKANLETYGTDGEMDRTILNRMIPALEHLLRNAVSHGIEKPEARRFAEKDEAGRISLYMTREATDIVLTLSDDGNGLDINAIREKAIAQNLIDPNAQVEDDDLMQCVLMPGFSTASEVTQIAGRGVGLDVVSSEVKQLGGSLDIDSQPGRGTSFTIRLPLTLAITDALLMRVGDDVFAIPHGSVEGVVRISRSKLIACESGEEEGFSYAGRTYKNFYLGSMLGLSDSLPHETEKWIPLLLVQSGERRVALRIDELLGTRQIVVKSVGKQVSSVPWITGGTILADGRVALILDVGALVRLGTAHLQEQVEEGRKAAKREEERRVRVMVVDDSITVRKVTSRLLERHDMDVVTAKDGVDAVALLQEQIPDIMLLDIEMPRMDGFELARHVHNSVEYYGLPIIMISSRVGEKHRKRAFALGVRRCLGKPYQEAELLENIKDVLAESET
ncbi:hybrid sensor histidine kinase/response regulator, partial [endosymbiont of Riftia pachyptila]|uniref:hybrid sensor histidine kinase/response regulator n=1 Tax=endosymbiont of Riftia pachyptila TaxID=54396 RepID=UPI001F11C62F